MTGAWNGAAMEPGTLIKKVLLQVPDMPTSGGKAPSPCHTGEGSCLLARLGDSCHLT